jgi:8-amino-7-oxononanoate synthase
VVRASAPSAPHDFSTNDYLGLARDQRVIRAFGDTGRAGSTGARLLSGAAPDHRLLERELASYVGRDDALLFSSGYLAAAGAIAALAPYFDVVYSDAQNHACLIDGIRLARAEKIVYPHLRPPDLASDARAKLVVTESLFGMDGDRADLASVLAALGPNDLLLVDEAHALGVEGPGGAGLCASLADPRVVVVGTLSKAFAAAGGFVAAPAIAVDFLANAARTFIFDTALPPGTAAGALASVRIARASDGDTARARLAANVARTHDSLVALRFLRADTAASHVVSIVFGDAASALDVQARLLEHGVLAPAIRPPTVAPGTSRIRVSLTAAHGDADLGALISALERCRTLAATS